MGPVTQEPIPERIVIKVPKRAPAPAAPPPEPEKAPKKGISDYVPTVSDTFEDMWEFTKGLVQIFPDMAKLGIEAIKDPKQYAKGLGKVVTTKAGHQAMKEFAWGFVPFSQVIREGPEILKTKPFSAGVVEAVAAIPLLGGMLRATGTIAKASGVGAKAEKLIKIGRYMETLPANAARAAIDKAVHKVSGGNLSLPHRREFLDIKAEVNTANAVAKENLANEYRQALGVMNKAELEQFYKSARLGPAPDASPKVLKALDLNDRVVESVAKAHLERGSLTKGQIEGAIAKKYAHEMGWNHNDPKAVAQAAREIRAIKAAGGRGPSYLPHVPVKGAWKLNTGDVVQDLITGGRTVRAGKVGQLEAFKGVAKYERDPRKVVARMLDDHFKFLSKVQLTERLRANPQLISGGAEPLEGLKAEGVFKKYFEDDIRFQGLKGITHPTIKRLVQWEFVKNPSNLIKAYDAVQGLFAKMATRWRPSFHIANVYSNAIFMALFGGDPILGSNLRAHMPSRAVANVGQSAREEVGKLARRGFLERGADVAQGADTMLRMGMISARTAEDLTHFGYTAERAFQSLPEVLRSTDDFNRLQIELTLLMDTVARRSRTVAEFDTSIAQLRAKEARLSDALGNFEAIEKTAPDSRTAQAIVDDLPIAGQKPGMPGPRLHKTKAQKQGLEEIKDLRQQIVNLEKTRQAVISDITSKKLMVAEREGKIPELKPMVDIVRKNVNYANAFSGEYNAMDGFEQAFVKRLIPFYAWSKAMTMLAFRLPFIAPVKSFMWHRFAQTLQTLANDPDMPERLKGYVPVYALKDGRTVWVNAGAYSPTGGLKTSKFAGIPIPGGLDPFERNPLLSLVFSFKGGKTLWTVGNVPFGEQMVSIGDGSVVRFGSDGLLHEEIPQTPLVSGLVNYFPLTQYLKSIVFPYWSNKFNWAGMPEPILNSDGSYRYPRELAERLTSAIGVPLTIRSKEDFQRQERARVQKIYRNFAPAYAREDEEGKAVMRSYIKDIQEQGKYKHIAER